MHFIEHSLIINYSQWLINKQNSTGNNSRVQCWYVLTDFLRPDDFLLDIIVQSNTIVEMIYPYDFHF